MKKVFNAVMAMVVVTAHADEAAQAKAELRAGQTFQCGGFIKASLEGVMHFC